MSKLRLLPILLGAISALILCACAHRPGQKTASAMPIPIMPLAEGHIPPVEAAPSESDNAAVMPMRVADVHWSGRIVHVAWDAPGATRAVISFSTDGTAFQTVAHTGEPLTQFTAPSPHGIIRIYVTDGKRRNTVDYRI